MKFKLDENLSFRLCRVFEEAGYQASTVDEEGLASTADPDLLNICCREDKVLVTLDKGFGNPFRFPPHQYKGIILLLPNRIAGKPQIRDVIDTAIRELAVRDIVGKLWRVRGNIIRVHRYFDPEE